MQLPFPRPALAATVLAVTFAASGPAHADDEEVLSFDEVTEVPLDAPRALPEATPSAEALLEGVGRLEVLLAGSRYDEEKGVYLSPLEEGAFAELTLDRRLQRTLEKVLDDYNVPYGAVVALDPRDGRILAMAEHSEQDSSVGLATRALYPAASVFKIVTGAALLEAGVSADTRVCYHGGLRRLQLKNLKDDPKRDRACASLAGAMGLSLNVVMAKLAARNLSVDDLRAMAGRFLFNRPLPVTPAPPSVGDALISPAVIPEDELEFGRAAAGFGRVYLSPLHGALIAGAIGNGGLAVEPQLIQAVVTDGGRKAPEPPRKLRVLTEDNAAVLTDMLERTVSEGTARRQFREKGRWVLGNVDVAGKTGSLADRQPYKDYSWFVGFAPVEQPRIAVAAVVVNGLKWRIKAPWLARETMRKFFNDEAADARAASQASK